MFFKSSFSIDCSECSSLGSNNCFVFYKSSNNLITYLSKMREREREREREGDTENGGGNCVLKMKAPVKRPNEELKTKDLLYFRESQSDNTVCSKDPLEVSKKNTQRNFTNLPLKLWAVPDCKVLLFSTLQLLTPELL